MRHQGAPSGWLTMAQWAKNEAMSKSSARRKMVQLIACGAARTQRFTVWVDRRQRPESVQHYWVNAISPYLF